MDKKGKERKKKDLDYRARIKLLCKVTVALTVIFVIMLVQLIVPAYTWLPAYSIPQRGEGELRVHFLDVGQGDCTVVEFPDGSLLVADAGNGTWTHNRHVVRYLRGLNASAPLVLLTHTDLDHSGGITEVLKRFGAERVYVPDVITDEVYGELFAAIEKAGSERIPLMRYGAIARAGAYAVCISPRLGGEKDENDTSIVLFLQYGGRKILLCSDISDKQERLLAAEYAADNTIFDCGEYAVRLDKTDILKVAHHGSGSSSCDIWLDLLHAETAVISCGRGNPYGHPAGGALERLAAWGSDVYRTDELGDIMVTISADGACKTEYGYL